MLMRAWRHPVTRSDRLGAYARYLSWKLHASVVSGPVLVPFVNETLLLAEPLSRETRELSLLVLKDPEAMAFVAHFLRGDEYFVDVGASIGSYAVLAAATEAVSSCVTVVCSCASCSPASRKRIVRSCARASTTWLHGRLSDRTFIAYGLHRADRFRIPTGESWVPGAKPSENRRRAIMVPPVATAPPGVSTATGPSQALPQPSS